MNDLERIKNEYGSIMQEYCKQVFMPILNEGLPLYEIISEVYDPLRLNISYMVAHNKEHEFIQRVYANAFATINMRNEAKNDNRSIQDLLDVEEYYIFKVPKKDLDIYNNYFDERENPFFLFPEELDDNKLYLIVRRHASTIERGEGDPEDAYARSVLFITFNKDKKNSVRIYNRYGRLYSDDLEVITKGLTQAFVREEGLIAGRVLK